MSSMDYGGYVYRGGVRVRNRLLMGSLSIRVELYRSSWVLIYRNGDRLDQNQFLSEDTPPEAFCDFGGRQELDRDYFRESGECCVFEIDDHRLEVFFTEEDNYYIYAKLIQPDGEIWYAWNGYGVGFEDDPYGYSSDDREETLRNLFPELKQVSA